jgi:dsRNA-specific ribonuclease
VGAQVIQETIAAEDDEDETRVEVGVYHNDVLLASGSGASTAAAVKAAARAAIKTLSA